MKFIELLITLAMGLFLALLLVVATYLVVVQGQTSKTCLTYGFDTVEITFFPVKKYCKKLEYGSTVIVPVETLKQDIK